MPRQRQYATAVNVPTTAETVAVTLPGISAPAGGVVDIDCTLEILPGTGTTAIAVKVERGTVAGGTQVGSTVNVFCTAAQRLSVGIQASDTLTGDVTGQQYVVTVTQTAATANGTVDVAGMQALY